MKIALIVEGESDKKIFERQIPLFSQIGLQVSVTQTGGKGKMCRGARRFHTVETLRGNRKVVFLPDQHGDPCALVTREKVGMDECPCALVVVVKRELEAWILADGEAVSKATRKLDRPAGLTDTIPDPKQELLKKLSRALGDGVTGVELAKAVSPHFSLRRAAKNNTSAKRFLDQLRQLAGR